MLHKLYVMVLAMPDEKQQQKGFKKTQVFQKPI
jgi:hypothetical protein